MSKNEAPALKMQIENGRLVPVAQWDQERVMSYRNGSIVNVRLTQEKNRKLERKYWAILHEVVEKCGIRQRTAEDLHKAIRLKLGVVDAYWTLDGKLRVDVKSTVGMEEPEYRQFFEDAMALLHKETGVDPLTLQAESADVGEEDNSQSSDTSTDDGSEDSTGSSVGDPAADSSPADEAGTEEGDNTGQVTTEQAAPSSTYSRADCVKAFMRTATDPALSVTERRDLLEQMKDWWKEAMAADLDFVKACLTTADKVVKGELQEAAARTYLDSIPAREGA